MNGMAFINVNNSTGNSLSSDARPCAFDRLSINLAGRTATKAGKAKKTGKTDSTKTRKKTTPKRATAAKIKPKQEKTIKKTTRKLPAKKTSTRQKTVKPVTKKKAKASITESKRRRARNYTVRSRLSSFKLGDDVIFKRVRDWNDSSKLVEMRGTVIALGSDPEIDVNYIEIQFEIENYPGKITRQVRRFTVK